MNRIRIDELGGKTRFFGVQINTHQHNLYLAEIDGFSTLPVPCFLFPVTFSAIHTDTNISILDDNICGMIHFSEWQSILTNSDKQANTTAVVGNVKAIRKA